MLQHYIELKGTAQTGDNSLRVCHQQHITCERGHLTHCLYVITLISAALIISSRELKRWRN